MHEILLFVSFPARLLALVRIMLSAHSTIGIRGSTISSTLKLQTEKKVTMTYTIFSGMSLTEKSGGTIIITSPTSESKTPLFSVFQESKRIDGYRYNIKHHNASKLLMMK